MRVENPGLMQLCLSKPSLIKFIECNDNVPPMYPPLNVVYTLFAGAVQQL